MKKMLLLIMLVVTTTMAFSQSTYFWVGGASADWNVPTNWNTTLGGGGTPRTTPNVGDALIFDGSNVGAGASSATISVTGAINQTISSLSVLGNNVNVSFATTTNTLGAGTIARSSGTVTGTSTAFTSFFSVGDFIHTGSTGNMSQISAITNNTSLTTVETGTISASTAYSRANMLRLTNSTSALSVAAGCTLSLAPSSANAFVISLVAGAKGTINGTVTLNAAAQRIIAADSRGLVFKSGSFCTTGTSFGGNPFASAANTTNDNISFESGATFSFGGGSNPFAATSPASVVEFQPGSTYFHNSTSAPSTSGRYFANFTVAASFTTGGGIGRVENLTVNSGVTLTIGSTNRISVTGNITVLGTGTIVNSGINYGDLLLCGSGNLQTINLGASTPWFRAFLVGTDANVKLASDIKVTTGATGHIFGTLDLDNFSIIPQNAGYELRINNANSTTTTLSSGLSANSVTIVTPSSSGVSNGMLVVSPAFPPNTYVINTASGTFTTSKYSIGSLASGSSISFSNGDANVSTSKSTGLQVTSPFPFTTVTVGGNIIFNTTTTTPFPIASGTTTIAPKNLTINAPITLNNNVNVSGTLTVATGGSIDLVANNITLISTSTNTARIASTTVATPFTYSGAGRFVIERFIPSKASRAWSLVTSPVGQLLNAGWQQQVHITGAGTGGTVCPDISVPAHTNGFDATTTNASSMFSYDASLAANSRWTAVANTNATSTAAGTGFRMSIRGPRSLGCALLDGTSLVPAAATLSATGTISNAAKNLGSFTIDYTNGATPSNYILMGNPYPSQISFSALQTDNPTIDNNYAIYAPGNTAGNYAYWDPIGGTYTGGNTGLVNATGNIIASGQAIFVKAISAGGLTLNFNETQKTSTTQNGYFRTTNFNEMVRIAYMLNDTNKADEIIVRYSNDARINNTTIGQMDIESMNAGSQYLTSLKSTKAMAVQTRSLKTLQTDTVALNVISSQNGTYKLSFSDYENFAAANIYLLDKYTNSTTAIKDNPVYSFTVDRTIAATQGQRFALVFAKAIVPQAVIAGIKMYPNPANKNLTVELPLTEGKYTLRITDVIGKQVYQNQIAGGVQAINISKLAQGNYVVEITDTKGYRAVEKLVKQ